jgi:hypothetical protein
MATIATILVGVILLQGKQNELTCEVFWWLVAGREHSIFFFPKKARNERWEVVVTPRPLVPVLLLVGIVRVHYLYLNPQMCKYQIFSTDIL